MAHIQCPNCKKTVSDGITNCPFCGNKLKDPQEKYGNMVIIGLVVVAVVFGIFLFTQEKPETTYRSSNKSENPINIQEQSSNREYESSDTEKKQDSHATNEYNDPDDVIGEYADMCPGMTTGTIVISKIGSEYLFTETFSGGGNAYVKKLKHEKKNGKHYFYIIPSAAGDYYVLEKNGDLSSYDSQGYISYATRKE